MINNPPPNSFITVSSNGGELILSLNVSEYEGQYLRLIYSFQADGFPTFQYDKVYFVSDGAVYTGSLLELRDYMLNNVSQFQRLLTFIIAFFIIMICLSILIRGFTNIIISMGLAVLIGWVIGLNIFILGTISVVLIVSALAWSDTR
jgi:hypothetical protein